MNLSRSVFGNPQLQAGKDVNTLRAVHRLANENKSLALSQIAT
ncbi:hypothetical protein JOD69_004936 [Methylocaldum sp. RMAD-M]|jgi:hypothetical protein|nr:hypothetical protein [Methylocaldum sp. RMAD-M]